MIAPEYNAPPIARCPFCHESATTCIRDEDRGHYVLCLGCEASGPASWFVMGKVPASYMEECRPQSEDDRRDVAAIFAWNGTARALEAGVDRLASDSSGVAGFWKDHYFKEAETRQDEVRKLRRGLEKLAELLWTCEKVLVRGPRAADFEADRQRAIAKIDAFLEEK